MCALYGMCVWQDALVRKPNRRQLETDGVDLVDKGLVLFNVLGTCHFLYGSKEATCNDLHIQQKQQWMNKGVCTFVWCVHTMSKDIDEAKVLLLQMSLRLERSGPENEEVST